MSAGYNPLEVLRSILHGAYSDSRCRLWQAMVVLDGFLELSTYFVLAFYDVCRKLRVSQSIYYCPSSVYNLALFNRLLRILAFMSCVARLIATLPLVSRCVPHNTFCIDCSSLPLSSACNSNRQARFAVAGNLHLKFSFLVMNKTS